MDLDDGKKVASIIIIVDYGLDRAIWRRFTIVISEAILTRNLRAIRRMAYFKIFFR